MRTWQPNTASWTSGSCRCRSSRRTRFSAIRCATPSGGPSVPAGERRPRPTQAGQPSSIAAVEIVNLTRDAAPFTTKDGSTIRELMHTGAQSLAEATLAPGQGTERHYHALSEELYFFLEGGGEMEIDGETRAVG